MSNSKSGSKGFSSQESSILKTNGYKESAYKADRFIDGSGNWVDRSGNRTSFGGLTENFGISKTLLDSKTKK